MLTTDTYRFGVLGAVLFSLGSMALGVAIAALIGFAFP